MVGIRDVGMSKCADTCQHADNVQMVCIKEADSDGTCWHMSAHISICQHMSACPNVLTHASMKVRSKWFVSEVPRVMLYVGTCRPISAHVGTCQHVHMCWHTLGYQITAVGKWGWIKSGARKKVEISLREVVSNKRVSWKKFWYLLQNYYILLEDMENSNKSGGIY